MQSFLCVKCTPLALFVFTYVNLRDGGCIGGHTFINADPHAVNVSSVDSPVHIRNPKFSFFSTAWLL